MKKASILVIFDSVYNSVFEGQVLHPLKKKALLHQATIFYIVSFEKNKPHNLSTELPDNIQIIFLKKYAFIGRISLIPCIRQLKKFVQSLSESIIELQARGPLAGYITLKALPPLKIPLRIQIRGLLAHEYRYCHQRRYFPLSLWHTIRSSMYASLEQYVFGYTNHHLIFEAVSEALKNYLINFFGTSRESIEIARDDIPSALDPAYKTKVRTIMRDKLGLKDENILYCYNGSAHPWQMPRETVQFFINHHKKNPSARLLILTHQQDYFKKIITEYEVPDNIVYLYSVPHNVIYDYLAAADYGIIFREPHILNWVSRPTKILEYQAVNLKIIHNSTIEMLCASDQSNNPAIQADKRLESAPPRTA